MNALKIAAGAVLPSLSSVARQYLPRAAQAASAALQQLPSAAGSSASEFNHAIQHTKRVSAAALGAFVDPTRDDKIAELGELTGQLALSGMLTRMRSSSAGRDILARRPRVRLDAEEVKRLAALPAGTFGHAYGTYLTENSFDPNDRKPVQHVTDADLAYVMQRYREVHDFWHALSGLPPTVAGELALKWLEMTHTGLPMAALASLVGPLRLSCSERRALNTYLVPWAVDTGNTCACLMSVPYEQLWERNLEDLRAELRFRAAPAHVLKWADKGLI